MITTTVERIALVALIFAASSASVAEASTKRRRASHIRVPQDESENLPSMEHRMEMAEDEFRLLQTLDMSMSMPNMPPSMVPPSEMPPNMPPSMLPPTDPTPAPVDGGETPAPTPTDGMPPSGGPPSGGGQPTDAPVMTPSPVVSPSNPVPTDFPLVTDPPSESPVDSPPTPAEIPTEPPLSGAGSYPTAATVAATAGVLAAGAFL